MSEGAKVRGIAEAAYRRGAVKRKRPVALSEETLAQGAWIEDLVYTTAGTLKASLDNVEAILRQDTRWAGVLAFCTFSDRILKRAPPPWERAELGEWSEIDDDRLRLWLAREYGFAPAASEVISAVRVIADANRVHPVREYLEGLRWDGTARLACWLQDFLGAENSPYVRAVGLRWMISAVARVMRPGCKADGVLILEGPQGIGKSSALAVLAEPWFSDSPVLIGDKDGMQQIQGVWICELAELDSFNKAESTRAKQYFGSPVDRYRPSYGKRPVDHPRQCVFAGSTNQHAYLKDPTGNRRYWPVACQEANLEALRAARDQLWAEALARYQDGEPWWPTEDEAPLFASEQDARFTEDVWQELIVAWLEDPMQRGEPYFTGAQILKGALGLEAHQMRQPEQMRLGYIMARIEWPRVRRRVAVEGTTRTTRCYVYLRPATSEDDDDAR